MPQSIPATQHYSSFTSSSVMTSPLKRPWIIDGDNLRDLAITFDSSGGALDYADLEKHLFSGLKNITIIIIRGKRLDEIEELQRSVRWLLEHFTVTGLSKLHIEVEDSVTESMAWLPRLIPDGLTPQKMVFSSRVFDADLKCVQEMLYSNLGINKITLRLKYGTIVSDGDAMQAAIERAGDIAVKTRGSVKVRCRRKRQCETVYDFIKHLELGGPQKIIQVSLKSCQRPAGWAMRLKEHQLEKLDVTLLHNPDNALSDETFDLLNKIRFPNLRELEIRVNWDSNPKPRGEISNLEVLEQSILRFLEGKKFHRIGITSYDVNTRKMGSLRHFPFNNIRSDRVQCRDLALRAQGAFKVESTSHTDFSPISAAHVPSSAAGPATQAASHSSSMLVSDLRRNKGKSHKEELFGTVDRLPPEITSSALVSILCKETLSLGACTVKDFLQLCIKLESVEYERLTARLIPGPHMLEWPLERVGMKAVKDIDITFEDMFAFSGTDFQTFWQIYFQATLTARIVFEWTSAPGRQIECKKRISTHRSLQKTLAKEQLPPVPRASLLLNCMLGSDLLELDVIISNEDLSAQSDPKDTLLWFDVLDVSLPTFNHNKSKLKKLSLTGGMTEKDFEHCLVTVFNYLTNLTELIINLKPGKGLWMSAEMAKASVTRINVSGDCTYENSINGDTVKICRKRI